MKRFVATVVAVVFFAFAAAGCAAPAGELMAVGALKGPTGMGMVALMRQEYANKYTVSLMSAPEDMAAAFISGEVNVAAVPINLASTLYNKLEGNVVLLAVNTLGVLYVLEAGGSVQSMGGLAGKTLYATGQAATPEYIINHLLEQNGLSGSVQVEYLSEHSELATLLAAGDATLGMLPEPNVTAAMAKNAELRVALDLTEEWNKVSDTTLVQGCIIAERRYYQQNQAKISEFLEDYSASTSFVNQHQEEAAALMEQHGIVPSAALAKQAISKCNIVCITGQEMRAAAGGMLEVLFAANPKSVGGALPGQDFYVE